ncbi:MAG TPA: L-lactate dehydrogenase [Roseiflexaceae bacterium]|nr:L-lactate dehydrogenase [Roseiflexaceae bacterium]
MAGALDPGNKVGLVGAGMVGMSFAYSLMQRGLANELVLIDVDRGRAEGEAMDLNHGLPFVRPLRIAAGDYEDLAGAAVVVIAAGVNQQPGQSRLDLLQRNADIFRDIVPRIVQRAPDAVIVIATNPVDILTQIAAASAGLPHGRVLGSGTILDTARFRYLLGEHYDVDPRSVHAYIVGEHGDSELALWSLANIAGVRLRDFHTAGGRGYDEVAMQQIFERTRDAAYEIIRRKRATYYAIGLGLLTIVEAVLRNQRTVLTVSTPMQGQYGVTGTALSLPTIVGRGGAEEVLTLAITSEEVAAFQRSAAVLEEHLRQLGAA